MDFLDALNNRVLVCDGAMGSVLYERGVFVNQAFEALNESQPELVTDVHRAYVEAGAEIIETNTFGANRAKLSGFGMSDRVDQINRAGVRLAREAGAPLVAGATGPAGGTVGAGGALSVADAASVVAEQAAALLDAGGDLVLLETFPDMSELLSALGAVRRLSTVPIVAQVSTGDEGLSRDGVAPETFAGLLLDQGATVIGVTCGAGPAATLESIERLAEATSAPLSAQPNAGEPREVEGRQLSLSSPDFFASYARRLVAEGVGLVGGCCGTTPAHIARIADAVTGTAAPRRVPAGVGRAS